MADSSYASEVQAILAFLSLQRTGGGGSGNHPQGPDAASEGLNPYGLVAPRFQRKFKAKQVPEGVGGGNDHGICPPIFGPWSSIHRAFLWKATCSVIASPETECAGPFPLQGGVTVQPPMCTSAPGSAHFAEWW